MSEQQLVLHWCHWVPTGNLYLPMKDWQVIHILPEGMVLVIQLFTVGQNRRKSHSHNSTAGLRSPVDFLSFISHKQENTLDLRAENMGCFLLKQDSASNHTWPLPARQVIRLLRRHLCSRRHPGSVRGYECMCAHAQTIRDISGFSFLWPW